MGSIAWKVLSVATRLASTRVATKVTQTGWRAATGKKAPTDRYEPERSHAEATAFAVVSAAMLAGATTFVERKVADYYTRSTGELAPPMQKAIEKREKKLQKEADKH
ncbi:DUF4235 domain-containing protein [Allobranchiibius sp. CTAmp26]|uniref:DUF4235 domain-containing protein n=1 Tax=Allobranchiibius sp. CTAmp26 TaxID=2815214 RepID=UPI001AA13E8D|nr:DUF4235 domain-containing protein [Allobranchiibius sp. CTAmp26]MBO1753983.1 DUF4235 domain-containing protein [Allobranchiibius sp. CTAmp26]